MLLGPPGVQGQDGVLRRTGAHWYVWHEATCTAGDAAGTWNDRASALYNASTSGNYAVVWEVDGLHGAHRCVAPGTGGEMKDLTLESFPGGDSMDNSISSNSWTSSPSSIC